jgi:hypothetical protein
MSTRDKAASVPDKWVAIPVLVEQRLFSRGAAKTCEQPHGSRFWDTNYEPNAGSKVRCTHARGHIVPTSRDTRPEAVPFARRVESWCAARCQKRKLQEWRLDR